MNQEQSIYFDDTNQIDILQFLSKDLFEKKQLKTINMFGGKGGFGLVLFVEDVQNPQLKYAIKAQSVINKISGQINQNALQMCKNEANVMRNCKHINIVEIHSDYEIGLYHFIQMNLCECSVSDWIEKNKQTQISDSIFLYLTNQILNGLEYLHNMDYVLRDLSVRNILLTRDGVIKLCDFGLAKKYDEDISSKILYTQCAKGVLFYYPPELINDITNNKEQVKQTKKGDIWAFGVCLSLIGGAKITEYVKVWNDDFQVPDSPNISQSANQLIKYILNKNPDERPNLKQIQRKICDLFDFNQNQIEIIGENILNLQSDQNIKKFNLDQINLNEQIEIPDKISNLSVFENNLNVQESIYKPSISSSDTIVRIIDFQFKKADQLLLQYENLLQSNSESNDILITLGFIEAQFKSNIKKAQQYFNKAIELIPNDLDAYIGLCECVIIMRERQSYQVHIEYLSSQINSNLQYWRLYYYLSNLYYLDQQQNNSQYYIKKALELNENSPLIISLQALIIFNENNNKVEEVMQLLGKSANLNKSNHPDIEIRRTLFDICFIKDNNATISKVKLLIDKGIKQLILYLNLLQLYNYNKNQTQYNFYKNLLLENYSNSYLVYEYLGNTEQDKKLKIQYYSQSIEIFPQNYYCIQKLEGLIDSNDYIKIILYYQKIIDIYPNDLKAYFKISEIYKTIIKNDKIAHEYYDKVLQLNPKNIEALFEIAQLQYKKNQKQKALQTYYKIIEFNKIDCLYYLYIGQIESELRCHKNSIQAYEKYIQINDKDFYAKKILAYEYIENEQFSSAIQLIKSQIQSTTKDNFNEQNSVCYYLLGKAEYRNKNYIQAKYYLEICLNLKNKNNEFESKIYHLKCQVRLKQKKKEENLKFQDLLNGFFIYLYQFEEKGKKIIADNFLDIKIYQNSQNLFIMAETLYDFNYYELSIKFFQKLLDIDQNNIDIYFYLGKMENSKQQKQKFYLKYIKVYQRDDKIIRFLAENCQNSTEKINYYKQLIDLDSKDIQSIEKLCEEYESLQQYNLQINLVDYLLKIDKNNEYGLLQIVKLIIVKSNLIKTDEYFINYIIPSQNSIQILLKFAMNNNLPIQQKFNCYQLILKIQPKHIITFEQLVYYYKQMENKDKYLQTIEDLLKIDIKNKCAIEELIQVIVNQECDVNQSKYYFKQYIQCYEESVTTILNLANQTEILKQKLIYYKLILKIQPKNIQVLEKIAKVQKEMKQLVEYENTLSLILGNEPQNEFAISELADFYYFHLKNVEKAALYYEQQLKFDENNVNTLKILGQIYFEKEQYSESQKIYEKIILIEPKSCDMLIKLGEVQFQLKNYSLSNDNYRKAEKIECKNGVICYNMGMNYYELQEYENSLQKFRKCYQLDKDHFKSYFMIGQILQLKQNKKEESIGFYRKAIECNNQFEDGYYYLGEAFIELNYAYEALNTFKQLLEINSEYQESQRCNDYIKENEQVEVKLFKKTSIDANCNIF